MVAGDRQPGPALAAPGACPADAFIDAGETQKDWQDIKALLARPAPPPSGIGAVIDLGANPVKGERTAKLWRRVLARARLVG